MDLITLDFETYYDRDFSLSKLTTEEYVRDHQFEVIGVGIKVNNEGMQTGMYGSCLPILELCFRLYR